MESSYPLTPLQLGMLFHHLSAPASGVDIEQIVFTLPEAVDGPVLRKAWEAVTARHAVLRTSFHCDASGACEQRVHDTASLEWVTLDWSAQSPDDVEPTLAAWLARDRERGFDLQDAPLHRLALARVSERDYRLVWTFHHIILDGRSMTIILNEVFGAYDDRDTHSKMAAAQVATAIQQLPPPPAFSEFVSWLTQRDREAESVLWREQLRGITAPSALPANAGSESSPHSDTGEPTQLDVEMRLDAESTQRVHAMAVRTGVTVNTLLQGAWAILLARHAGARDVVFGTTRACRRGTSAQADAMVGLLINTVPLRVHVDPDVTVEGYLVELRQKNLALRAIETTPLHLIQQWSDVPAGVPLLETLLVFESAEIKSTLHSSGGEWAAREMRPYDRTNFALSLWVNGASEMLMKLDYDATRFDAGTAKRLLGQVATLLRGMTIDPTMRVKDIPWLDAAERALVVDAWNSTATNYPREQTIGERFADWVQATPDATAVVHGSRALSYRELDLAATKLARRLRSLGVGADVPVGLCMPRSADMVVAALGILKAGGAYVTLDPEYPAARLAQMLTDCAAPVVLTVASLASKFAPGSYTVLCMDRDWNTIDTESAAPLESVVNSLSAAYLIYTSGSTGTPKGVVAVHRAVLRLVCNSTFATLDDNEVWLSFAPLNFDASTLELWGALLNGARLVIYPNQTPSLEDLGEVITTHGVTSMWLTAALFQQFVERHLDGLAPLRQLLAGGDVLSPAHVRRVRERFPSLRLINGYGPTENTTFTCCYDIPAAEFIPDPIPIGRPISNTTVYVLDDAMRPVPVGVPGRLFAGGDGLARGYLNAPELTAARFVPNPFSSEPGARLYDTGDLARWRADGQLAFLGRVDAQVKIRGFRVEPGEIEVALGTHPAVLSCCVIAREDVPGDRRLVAYLVLNANEPHVRRDGEAFRGFLRPILPPYLIPSAFVVLPEFPLTSSGKVDRKALPAPFADSATDSTMYVAPRNIIEEAMCAIWAQVLRVPRVGVDDNFFALGGDSILLIQIAARTRDAGIPVTVSGILGHPSVGELADSLTGRHDPVIRTASAPATVTSLTPIQRWFFELDVPSRNHWNQTFLFRLARPLDRVTLAASVSALLHHHAALRTRFTPSGATWMPARDDSAAATDGHAVLRVHDLSALPDDAVHAEMQRINDDAARSLDIARGPNMRCVYFNLGPERGARLLLTVHHLVVDGISWRILREDLETAYSQIASALPVSLPPVQTSYDAWASALASLAERGTFTHELAYWQDVASGALLELPAANASGLANTIGNARTLVTSLTAAETSDLLQRAPAAYATQVNDLLITALGAALAPWTGSGTLLLNLEGHGREELGQQLDISRTVGWFTSMFPLRLELDTADVGTRIKRTKEALRAVPGRGIGYGVLKYLAAHDTLREQPQAEVLFNYLGQFDQLVADSALFSFAPESEGAWFAEDSERRHVLEVNALVLNGSLEFRWTYAAGMHDAAIIRGVADAMTQALRSIIVHCTAPDSGGRTPSDFPLVSLSQPQVDGLAGNGRAVEDIVCLAPMQSLFLTAGAGGSADVGFEQWLFDIDGPLNTDAFRQAWQMMTERHQMLRVGFTTTGLSTPVQVIHRQAALPVSEIDWRTIPTADHAQRLAELLATDRARGFDAARPPLMRITLVRLTDNRWTMLWSNHHLLLDRWSWPIILREVGAAYAAICAGQPADLPASPPWKRYLTWLHARDAQHTASFWTAALDALEPAPLPRLEGAGGTGGEVRIDLSVAETSQLMTLARGWRVPMNAVVSTAWALWLRHVKQSTDVVFGMAVSGRPDEVRGVDRLVGMCINNVPSRVQLSDDESALTVLRRLVDAQRAADLHSHATLSDLQLWSGLPWHKRLFDTLVVFQNGADDEVAASWLGDELAVRMHATTLQTNYPLALAVGGSDALTLRLSYQGHAAGAEGALAALAAVRRILNGWLDNPEATVQTLLRDLPAAPLPVGSDASTRAVKLPSSNTQWAVANIWAELLGRNEVGVDENFFALGGQSLVATQIMARLRDAFRADLPVALLFEAPTVERFSEAMQARESTPGQTERIAGIIKRVEMMTMHELREAGING